MAKSASGTHSRTLRSLGSDKKVAVKRVTTVCALLSTGSGVQGLEHAVHVSKSGRERESAHVLLQTRTSCLSDLKLFVCASHRHGTRPSWWASSVSSLHSQINKLEREWKSAKTWLSSSYRPLRRENAETMYHMSKQLVTGKSVPKDHNKGPQYAEKCG